MGLNNQNGNKNGNNKKSIGGMTLKTSRPD